jgi:protein-L-isoaspartate(D-aspartate) O-methyltransferase
VHARYLQALALTGTERVLEIGTGSGYQTVLLSHLAAQVFSVERIAPLLERAREAIAKCAAKNVSLHLGDGTHGWAAYAPYDAILVSAASPDVPQPLLDQLADGGRLLVPVGGREEQKLLMITRTGTSFARTELAPVRFVPLVGDHGWAE